MRKIKGICDSIFLNGAESRRNTGAKAPLHVIRGAASGRNYCGTAACACGLAMTIPALRREGLKSRPSSITQNPVPIYGDAASWDAIRTFFDIPMSDALELFSYNYYDASDYTNPIAVADKITALLHT